MVGTETFTEYCTLRLPLFLGQIEHAGTAEDGTEEARQELWSLHRHVRVGVDLCCHMGRHDYQEQAAHWP